MSHWLRTLEDRLREGAGEVWESLFSHPFVKEMAAGTLPAARFRFYVEQNIMYLPELSRAMSVGAGKARSVPEMILFTSNALQLLEVEVPHQPAAPPAGHRARSGREQPRRDGARVRRLHQLPHLGGRPSRPHRDHGRDDALRPELRRDRAQPRGGRPAPDLLGVGGLLRVRRLLGRGRAPHRRPRPHAGARGRHRAAEHLHHRRRASSGVLGHGVQGDPVARPARRRPAPRRPRTSARASGPPRRGCAGPACAARCGRGS